MLFALLAVVTIHFQGTVASQAHPDFAAAYDGPNSLQSKAEQATSVVLDLFFGASLWQGGELYFQPELTGGLGLSSTLGVAAFPSGEVYRVGNPQPAAFPARVFFRQVIGLGGGSEEVADAPGQVPTRRDRDRLTLTAGKLSTPDVFDANPVAFDPHTRFESWGLWASAAYDYPADTRGYTWGATGDLTWSDWSVRAGIFLEPKYANLLPMETDLTRARGLALEGERRFEGGAVRALVFLNTARMGNYDEATAQGVNVTATRLEGRNKYGFAASANYDFARGVAGFVRASWSDGKNETWAFTEIDHSAALGVVVSGDRWRRPDDEAGAAAVVSGLATPHRRYLEAGGLGYIIGDGALRYGPELLGELYYRAQLSKEVSAAVHWQPIVNPAFNRDRGPVNVFTVLAHVAF